MYFRRGHTFQPRLWPERTFIVNADPLQGAGRARGSAILMCQGLPASSPLRPRRLINATIRQDLAYPGMMPPAGVGKMPPQLQAIRFIRLTAVGSRNLHLKWRLRAPSLGEQTSLSIVQILNYMEVSLRPSIIVPGHDPNQTSGMLENAGIILFQIEW